MEIWKKENLQFIAILQATNAVTNNKKLMSDAMPVRGSTIYLIFENSKKKHRRRCGSI